VIPKAAPSQSSAASALPAATGMPGSTSGASDAQSAADEPAAEGTSQSSAVPGASKTQDELRDLASCSPDAKIALNEKYAAIIKAMNTAEDDTATTLPDNTPSDTQLSDWNNFEAIETH
jgi:hypothetical protein